MMTAALNSLAQCPGEISGYVKEQNSMQPIADVSIEYFDKDGNSDTVFTDSNGHFVILGIDCNQRYDLVAFREGYNGFTEIQVIPKKNNKVNLYLDAVLPPQYEEEIYDENTITVEDPDTGKKLEEKKVGEGIADLDVSQEKELSFYERKELARKQKEERKRQRIEAERKAEEERQKAQKQRIAEAKKALEERRRMLEEERKRIMAEAKKEAELRKKELAEQEKAKEENIRLQRQKREQAVARAKNQYSGDDDVFARPGEQVIVEDEEEKLLKKRDDRIARAKAQAEALKKQEEENQYATEQPTADRQDQTKREINPPGDDKNNLKEQLQKEREERIARAKAQAEALKRQEEENQRAAEERAQAERQRREKAVARAKNQSSGDDDVFAHPGETVVVEDEKAKLLKEREERIARAKAQAEALKRQEEENQRAAEEQSLTQNRNRQNADDDVFAKPRKQQIDRREQMRREREERIARAKAQAEALKKQKEAEKAAETEEPTLVSGPDYSNPKRCAFTIRGIIKNGATGKPVKGATIDIYFEGENIESTRSDSNGEFVFANMECNTKYTIISYKAEIDDIAKFTLNTGKFKGLVKIKLTPEKPKAPVAAATPRNKPKPRQANPPKQKEEQQKIIVENEEPAEDLSKAPVSMSEFQKKQEKLTENITDYESFIKAYPQYSNVETPEVIDKKVKLNNIYFDLDEYYLTREARKELDKIVVLMIKNPNMIIEAGSHTDSRGPFDYNLELSEKRSQEVVGYLIANGVDPDRITGRGYGETMPLNRCVDGVKCTEEEYLVNRRTEFVILHQ